MQSTGYWFVAFRLIYVYILCHHLCILGVLLGLEKKNPEGIRVSAWYFIHTNRKLSSKEMDRRRQEMMENARWRDEQRETNIAKYREEDEKEEKNSKQKDTSSSFLKYEYLTTCMIVWLFN